MICRSSSGSGYMVALSDSIKCLRVVNDIHTVYARCISGRNSFTKGITSQRGSMRKILVAFVTETGG